MEKKKDEIEKFILILKIIIWIIAVFIIFQIIVRTLRKFIHFSAPAFIGKLLDSNYRRKLQSPQKIIERSGIKKGIKIMDVGCGSGVFITFTAEAVDNKGKVYALDIQEKC